MTIKEKAEELFQKFYKNYGYYGIPVDAIKNSKQCALITVENILNLGLLINQPSLEKSNKCKPNISHKEYWEKVKKEIKKL